VTDFQANEPALLLEEQTSCWRRGERVAVEDLLARRPGLGADGLLDLITNEVLLRQQAGETPLLEEYLRRFPDLAEPLRMQFEVERAIHASDPVLGSLWAEATLVAPGATRGAEAAPPGVPGYEVQHELGRGSMGVVYKARQKSLNRVVALKMILAGGGADPESRRRFLAEAEAIAAVKHPGIVQVHDFGTHNGVAYFSLEFCEGGSLAGKLKQGALPPVAAARLLEQIARAVQAAHDKGIVHRDLKPANVLLDERGLPRVSDFGLAKRLDGGPGLTQYGAVMGTPTYMAPEQAQGKKEIGPWSDVYALGAILYHCLTGRPPFKAAHVADMLLQVMRNEPVPPRRLVPGVPRDLETICLKCMAKDPARRYASARDLADDLERFLQGDRVQAPPVSGRRWPRVVLAAALLTVGVGLAAGLAVALTKVPQSTGQRGADPAPPVAVTTLTGRLVESAPNTFTGPLAEELRPLRDIVLGLKAPVDAHTLTEIAAARKAKDYEIPDVHYFTYALEPALRLEAPVPRLRWSKDHAVRVAVYVVAREGSKVGDVERLTCSARNPGEVRPPARPGTLCRLVVFVFPLDEAAYTHLRQNGFTAKLVKGE
jgi:serine/threonine protein kinase